MRSRDPRLGRLWSAPAAAHTVPEQHMQQVGIPSGTAGLHHPADTSQQKPQELRVACSVANLRQLYVTRQDLAVLEAVECKLEDIDLSSSAHRSVLRGTVVRLKYRGRYRLRKVLDTYREPQSGRLLLHLHDVGRRALAVEVASSHNLLAPHKLGQAAQEEVAELAALMACNTSLLWTLDEAAGAAWRLKCALCWRATQSTDLAELVLELVNPEGVQSMKAGAEPLTFADCQQALLLGCQLQSLQLVPASQQQAAAGGVGAGEGSPAAILAVARPAATANVEPHPLQQHAQQEEARQQQQQHEQGTTGQALLEKAAGSPECGSRLEAGRSTGRQLAPDQGYRENLWPAEQAAAAAAADSGQNQRQRGLPWPLAPGVPLFQDSSSDEEAEAPLLQDGTAAKVAVQPQPFREDLTTKGDHGPPLPLDADMPSSPISFCTPQSPVQGEASAATESPTSPLRQVALATWQTGEVVAKGSLARPSGGGTPGISSPAPYSPSCQAAAVPPSAAAAESQPPQEPAEGEVIHLAGTVCSPDAAQAPAGFVKASESPSGSLVYGGPLEMVDVDQPSPCTAKQLERREKWKARLPGGSPPPHQRAVQPDTQAQQPGGASQDPGRLPGTSTSRSPTPPKLPSSPKLQQPPAEPAARPTAEPTCPGATGSPATLPEILPLSSVALPGLPAASMYPGGWEPASPEHAASPAVAAPAPDASAPVCPERIASPAGAPPKVAPGSRTADAGAIPAATAAAESMPAPELISDWMLEEAVTPGEQVEQGFVEPMEGITRPAGEGDSAVRRGAARPGSAGSAGTLPAEAPAPAAWDAKGAALEGTRDLEVAEGLEEPRDGAAARLELQAVAEQAPKASPSRQAGSGMTAQESPRSGSKASTADRGGAARAGRGDAARQQSAASKRRRGIERGASPPNRAGGSSAAAEWPAGAYREAVGHGVGAGSSGSGPASEQLEGWGIQRRTPTRCLWVGNLGCHVGFQDLERTFARFGRVEDVKVFGKKHWVEVAGGSKKEPVGGGLITFKFLEAALDAKKALENTMVPDITAGSLRLALKFHSVHDHARSLLAEGHRRGAAAVRSRSGSPTRQAGHSGRKRQQESPPGPASQRPRREDHAQQHLNRRPADLPSRSGASGSALAHAPAGPTRSAAQGHSAEQPWYSRSAGPEEGQERRPMQHSSRPSAEDRADGDRREGRGSGRRVSFWCPITEWEYQVARALDDGRRRLKLWELMEEAPLPACLQSGRGMEGLYAAALQRRPHLFTISRSDTVTSTQGTLRLLEYKMALLSFLFHNGPRKLLTQITAQVALPRGLPPDIGAQLNRDTFGALKQYLCNEIWVTRRGGAGMVELRPYPPQTPGAPSMPVCKHGMGCKWGEDCRLFHVRTRPLD